MDLFYGRKAQTRRMALLWLQVGNQSRTACLCYD